MGRISATIRDEDVNYKGRPSNRQPLSDHSQQCAQFRDSFQLGFQSVQVYTNDAAATLCHGDLQTSNHVLLAMSLNATRKFSDSAVLETHTDSRQHSQRVTDPWALREGTIYSPLGIGTLQSSPRISLAHIMKQRRHLHWQLLFRRVQRCLVLPLLLLL
jgi:hypothetical protein